jgi:hypothetical protein
VKRIHGDAGTVCAVTAAGRVHCWGDNQFAECGTARYRRIGDMDLIAPAPVEVPSVRAAVDVVAGPTSCARLADGGVVCWGRALGSQIRDKAASDYLLSLPRTGADERAVASRPLRDFYRSVHHPPERLAGISSSTGIAAGSWLWTLLADGTVAFHRLDRTRPKLERLAGVIDAVALAAGNHLACATTRAADVLCWSYGNPDGWLPGSDAGDDPGPPVRVGFARDETWERNRSTDPPG